MTLVIFLIIIIICITILYGIHLYKHYTIPDNQEILQLNNYDKDRLEEYLLLKQPIILMNTLTEIDLFEKLHHDELKKRAVKLDFYTDINSDKKESIIYGETTDRFIFEDVDGAKLLLTNEYYNFIKMMQSNIMIYNKNTLTVFNAEMCSPIIKMKYSRNLYMLFDGEIIFTLYPPKYDKDMYHAMDTSEYSISAIHPKKISDEKTMMDYPSFKKAYSIDIIMRPGQILSIPPFWWYSIQCKKDCLLISNKSDTVFTKAVNLF